MSGVLEDACWHYLSPAPRDDNESRFASSVTVGETKLSRPVASGLIPVPLQQQQQQQQPQHINISQYMCVLVVGIWYYTGTELRNKYE